MRGGVRSAIADDWYGTSWECDCKYTNVGTDRCYFCNSRAPAEIHPQVAAVPASDAAAALDPGDPPAVASPPK